MKILFLSSLYGDETGGAEISTKILFEGLLKKGLDVKLATLIKKDSNEKVLQIPYSNLIPKKLSIQTTPITDKIMEIGLSKLVKKEMPDLIHIQDMSITTAGVKVSKRFNITTIATIRDYRFLSNICDYDNEEELRPLTNIEFKKILLQLMSNKKIPKIFYSFFYLLFRKQSDKILNSIKECNKVISISNFVRFSLLSQGVSKNKIETIHIFTSPLKKYPSKKEEEIIIFAPGRLHKAKGFDYLLRAFNMVLKKEVNIKLIIAGDGPEKRNLEELSRKLKIDNNIDFVGKISFEEMNEFYSKSDFVIVPSLWPEPLGRVALEAFTLKKPVIATKVGGIPEVVSENEGFLVSPRDEVDLSKKILILAQNRKLREKKGLKAYKKYTTIENPQRGIEAHIKLYNSLLQNKK